MRAMITKTRTLIVMLLMASSVALVTACDEVEDGGDGMAPPEQPLQ